MFFGVQSHGWMGIGGHGHLGAPDNERTSILAVSMLPYLNESGLAST